MITSENITRRQARKLVKLLDQWTRAEVMSRIGRFDNMEFADYAHMKIEIENKLREMLYGTSDLVGLSKLFKKTRKRMRDVTKKRERRRKRS
jgi:low affinity Fe/Cu permease